MCFLKQTDNAVSVTLGYATRFCAVLEQYDTCLPV